jgi:hypothetical protein
MRAKHTYLSVALAVMLFVLFGNFNVLLAHRAIPAPGGPLVASFPFADNFESGAFGADWSTTTTNNGIAEVNGDYPHGGLKSAFIGQKVNGNATAALILAINLSGQPDVFLDFWWRATGVGTYTDSSLYISDNNGATWTKIRTLNDNSRSYSHMLVNIAAAAAANGLTLNSQFKIRFLFSTTVSNSQANNGLVLDDLRLTTRMQEVAVFPFPANGFEVSDWPQGMFLQSGNNGVVEINGDYPHAGLKNAFLGQKVSGNATAILILAVDLSGQSDVFLDFWWRATGVGTYTDSGLYISDNDGTTWTEIRPLNDKSPSYSHMLVNITSAAAANGLALNNRFQIRFHFSTTVSNSQANNGLVLDDVRLTTRAQEVATFPFPQHGFEAGNWPQGMFLQSGNNGIVEINGDYPHSGLKSAFMGQKVSGSATAALILAIDLSSQSGVFLDFWWRSTGVGTYTDNGLYISDNDGSTWTKIRTLNSRPSSYEHVSLNIAGAAAANGLTLNNRFQIRFLFSTTSGSSQANNGLVFDDLRLGTIDPISRVYLPLVRK